VTIGRFLFIARVKCPYRVAGKASALGAKSGCLVECPYEYRIAGKASALGAESDIPKSAYSTPTARMTH